METDTRRKGREVKARPCCLREKVGMSVDFKTLLAHRGHEIEITTYGVGDTVFNVSLECLDCNEVLLDFDNEGLEEEDE